MKNKHEFIYRLMVVIACIAVAILFITAGIDTKEATDKYACWFCATLFTLSSLLAFEI